MPRGRGAAPQAGFEPTAQVGVVLARGYRSFSRHQARSLAKSLPTTSEGREKLGPPNRSCTIIAAKRQAKISFGRIVSSTPPHSDGYAARPLPGSGWRPPASQAGVQQGARASLMGVYTLFTRYIP